MPTAFHTLAARERIEARFRRHRSVRPSKRAKLYTVETFRQEGSLMDTWDGGILMFVAIAILLTMFTIGILALLVHVENTRWALPASIVLFLVLALLSPRYRNLRERFASRYPVDAKVMAMLNEWLLQEPEWAAHAGRWSRARNVLLGRDAILLRWAHKTLEKAAMADTHSSLRQKGSFLRMWWDTVLASWRQNAIGRRLKKQENHGRLQVAYEASAAALASGPVAATRLADQMEHALPAAPKPSQNSRL